MNKFVVMFCVFTGIVSPALAGSCETAAMNYYCTAVTLALGKASANSPLGTALTKRAAMLDEEAKRLGYADLKQRYYTAGVQDVGKAADPTVMERLIGTCVKSEPRFVQAFEATVTECDNVRN